MYRKKNGKGRSAQTRSNCSRDENPPLIETVQDSSKEHRTRISQMSERSRFLVCILLTIVVFCGFLSTLRSGSEQIEEARFQNLIDVLLDQAERASSIVTLTSVPRKDLSEDRNFYAVIFDGGSTGSRVHVFHFQRSERDSLPHLVNEIYNYTTHGLSTYAHNPEKGAASLNGLMSEALLNIPVQLWDLTPVALKATAGLRLLPKDQSDHLLNEVYKLFLKSPLHVDPIDQSVTILDGAFEGIYLWQAINFLKGYFASSSRGTSAVIDLGGGSVQVTYSPQDIQSIVHQVDDRDIMEINVFGQSYFLFVHSYLGNGLIVALLGILHIEKAINTQQFNILEENNSIFTSICLPPQFKGTLRFGDTDILVKGSDSISTGDIFVRCTSFAKMFIDKQSIPKLPERLSSFDGAGYLLSRADKYKLIDENQENGKTSLTIKEFEQHAKQACSHHDISLPYKCLDIVYMSTLFSYGLGLHEETQIIIQDKINDVETSWALGAAFDILHNHWKSNS